MQQMLVLMVVVLILAVGMLLVGRRARPVAWSLIAVLIYLPSYWIWFLLQYLQIVPVDALLATVGVPPHRLVDSPFGTLVQLGPPLLPSLGLLGWSWRSRHRSRVV